MNSKEYRQRHIDADVHRNLKKSYTSRIELVVHVRIFQSWQLLSNLTWDKTDSILDNSGCARPMLPLYSELLSNQSSPPGPDFK